jgi:hypothetical protein
VADLHKKGAAALGDAQLKAFIVGKALWLRNNVTGEAFKASYTAEGQYRIWFVGRNATLPSNVGNPVQTTSYLGITSPYKIENGKIVVTLSQEPYSMTFLQIGQSVLRSPQQ